MARTIARNLATGWKFWMVLLPVVVLETLVLVGLVPKSLGGRRRGVRCDGTAGLGQRVKTLRAKFSSR